MLLDTLANLDLKAQLANQATTAHQAKKENQVAMELQEPQANQSSVRRANLAIMAPLAFLEVLDYPAKTAILAALDLLDQRETLVPQASLSHPKSLDLRAPQDIMAKTELLAQMAALVPLAQLDLKDLKEPMVNPEQTATLVVLDQKGMTELLAALVPAVKMVILAHQAI